MEAAKGGGRFHTFDRGPFLRASKKEGKKEKRKKKKELCDNGSHQHPSFVQTCFDNSKLTSSRPQILGVMVGGGRKEVFWFVFSKGSSACFRLPQNRSGALNSNSAIATPEYCMQLSNLVKLGAPFHQLHNADKTAYKKKFLQPSERIGSTLKEQRQTHFLSATTPS